MRLHKTVHRTLTLLLVGAVALLSPMQLSAQLANLADVPLAQAPTSSVLPNLMYILDDSGSMNYNYMPDQVQTTSGGQTYRNCKLCGTPNTVETTGTTTLQVNSASTSNERITASANHGGTVGSTVIFTSGTPPAPLATNTVYFISSVPSGTTFTLAATSGGATINLTNTTSGARFLVDRERVVFTNNHGGAVGQTVVFTSGTPPAPFALNTTYYIVRVVNSDSLVLSATPGGAPINPTNATAGATADINGGTCGGPSGASAGSGVPCGNDETNANTPSTTSSPDYGEAPFYATVFNRIWYNPDITYSPAVDSTGTPMTANNPTNASPDKFLGGTTKNLVTNFEEVVYCNTATPTAADLSNTSKCRYQGKHNVGPFLGGQPSYFLYWKSTGQNEGLPNTVFFYKVRVVNSNPHYYNITPHEYCSDLNLVNCALAAANGSSPGGLNTIPAPVRWCKTSADAVSTAVVTGTTGTPATPRCRKKFDRAAGYVFPRYGRFTRVDIVPSGTFNKGPNAVRTDCASATSCTYAEELQNFANWYGYYRVRMALMKTSTGRAFLSIDDRYRVGFITINPNNPVSASKFLGVGQFNAAQRSAWYTKLYAQSTNGSTPLREALSRVGRYYGGISSGINAGMGADPMQYSCQTNYALLTTDGYWNQPSQVGQSLSGGGVGNQDNVDGGFTTRGVGAFDGGLPGSVDTLADVAAYYYKTDLRTSGPLSQNNVPTSQKDTAAHQHMVTFGLGLGLEGLMDYVPDYETNNSSDFAKIKNGESGSCSWTTGTCDWPVPAINDPSTLDDLWHAAANGRGAYFSASDPNSLAQGLQSALAKLKVQTAAAAASATSSPNITQTDNFIYSSTFRTGLWDGEIVAQRIDVATGNVLPAIAWSAQALLDGRTSANSDGRTIYTIDESGGNKIKNFTFANLTNTASGAILPERPYFANKCGALGQCVLLTASQQAIANDGTNLVNYLRGHRQYEQFTLPETTAPFRTREHILGDTVNSTPAYVRRPSAGYTDAVTPTYEDFKAAQDGRTPVLYVASNDGMLHALNGDTGQEIWAYVPRITMPNMHRLANANWGATHRFSVDGSPTTADVFVGGQWRTILVAGLNAGGRGYYALDITDPASPKVLWEICSDATLCQIVEPNMGYSYGNAEIGKRAFDNKWVVYLTSGLNNVSPGDGKAYLYVVDVLTGTVLNRVLANPTSGSTTAPLGLNRIAGFADNPFVDNKIRMIYGGDLFGNLYKFDTTVNPPVPRILATLKDGTGKPQSITTRPELAVIDTFPVVYVGTGRYLGADDLVDPATLVPPLPFAYQNTLYGIKDKNTSYGNFRTANVVINTLNDLGTTRTSSNNPVDWTVRDGWYVDFNPGNTSPGERVNLDPQLVLGTLVVVGNVPNNSVCTVGGDAYFYAFDYKSGRNVVSSAGGVTGYKITGQTLVGFVVFSRGGGGGALDAIATGATGEKIRLPVPIGGSGGKARRTSWRELIREQIQ